MVKIRKHKHQPEWRELPSQKTSQFEIMTRYEWQAAKPLNTKTLLLPVMYVRFLLTGTGPCRSEKECIRVVKKLQKDAMEIDKKDDIPYNFLVTDVGHVFEGRGWWVEADREPQYSHLEGNCFDIAYVGTYDPDSKYISRRGPPETALVAAREFVKYCVECKLLVEEYKEIPWEESLPPKPPPPEEEKEEEYYSD